LSNLGPEILKIEAFKIVSWMDNRWGGERQLKKLIPFYVKKPE
jgi:hypothetical protein